METKSKSSRILKKGNLSSLSTGQKVSTQRRQCGQVVREVAGSSPALIAKLELLLGRPYTVVQLHSHACK